MISRRKFLGAAGLAAAWPGAAWPQPNPKPKAKAKADKKADKKGKGDKPEGFLVNDVHAQLSSTLVFKIVESDSLDAVRGAFLLARREERTICIAGGRHAMGAQQFGADGVLIDTRKLNQVLDFDAERGTIEVEAGVQWPRLYEFLESGQRGRDKQWTFAQKPDGVDRTTIGGCLSANAHGRGLAMPPLVADIESFKLVDARGELRSCSREENADLFRLAIGGYGLFGFVYSVKLRLQPRRKLERVSELRAVDGLAGAFAERFSDGFLYGDLQLSTDDKSPDYLRQGVFTCYRGKPADTPMPTARQALDGKDRLDLMVLAHSNKAAGFKRYAEHYLANSGQLYWSDEQQMSPYTDNYHRELDRRLQAPKGTDVMTEICCEREGLERFMAEVRQYALREGVEIVQASVRVIEQDKESFLAWARRPYACVTFNVHLEHSTRGMIRAGDAFRRLIDIGLRYGGSYYPTYHKHALRRQVDACFPQLAEFLKLKLKYDPGEFFQSDWYRHYKNMFSIK